MTLENVLLEPTLDTVKGILILDNDGKRILAKYYDGESFPNTAAQKKFEKSLFTKTHKANAEIIMLDGFTCLYKSSVDLFFYVTLYSTTQPLVWLPVLLLYPPAERWQCDAATSCHVRIPTLWLVSVLSMTSSVYPQQAIHMLMLATASLITWGSGAMRTQNSEEKSQ